MSSAKAKPSRGASDRRTAGRAGQTASRWWRAFRDWRRRRPFWAGLLILLAGLPILYFPYAHLSLGGVTVQMSTVSGAGSLIIGLLLVVLGVSVWFQPPVRFFCGVAAILLSLVSLVVSNFGGFGMGLILGLLGGGLALAWSFDRPAAADGPDGGGGGGGGPDGAGAPPPDGPAGARAEPDTGTAAGGPDGDRGEAPTEPLPAAEPAPAAAASDAETAPGAEAASDAGPVPVPSAGPAARSAAGPAGGPGKPDDVPPDDVPPDDGAAGDGARPESAGNDGGTRRRPSSGSRGRGARMAALASLPTLALVAGTGLATASPHAGSGSGGPRLPHLAAGAPSPSGTSANGPCALPTSSPSPSDSGRSPSGSPSDRPTDRPSPSGSPSAGRQQDGGRGTRSAPDGGARSGTDAGGAVAPPGRSADGSAAPPPPSAPAPPSTPQSPSPTPTPSAGSDGTPDHPVKDFFDGLFGIGKDHRGGDGTDRDGAADGGGPEGTPSPSTSPAPTSPAHPDAPAAHPHGSPSTTPTTGGADPDGGSGRGGDGADERGGPTGTPDPRHGPDGTGARGTDTGSPHAGDHAGSGRAGKDAKEAESKDADRGGSKGEDPNKTTGKWPYPCPTELPKNPGSDDSGVHLPKVAWHLDASKLTLKGLYYRGRTSVDAGGRQEPVMKFTATGIDIGDLDMNVKLDNGSRLHVAAAKGSTSTFRDGTVTMYTKDLNGKMFGLIPVSFKPEKFKDPWFMIPLNKLLGPLPIPAVFTDVSLDNAGQFGGTLKIPGMHIYSTGD